MRNNRPTCHFTVRVCYYLYYRTVKQDFYYFVHLNTGHMSNNINLFGFLICNLLNRNSVLLSKCYFRARDQIVAGTTETLTYWQKCCSEPM